MLKAIQKNGDRSLRSDIGALAMSTRVADSTPYFVITAGGRPVELRTQARADAKLNLPKSDAQQPNEVETSIEREHERQHLELVEQTRNDLRELTARFEALEDQLPSVEDVGASIPDSLAAIERDLAANRSLVSPWLELQLRRRDLIAFVREHGLAREASYPASRLLSFGIIAVVIVAESVANAAFFAKADALGLVGGFGQALAVSGINVISGLFVGYFCVRGLNR